MTTVVDVLVAAKSEIETQGWRQGARFVYPPRGAADDEKQRLPGCCALDAFLDARIAHNFNNAALAAAQDVLAEAFATIGGKDIYDLLGWNDAPERTAADVLALYDKAIALASSRQEDAP